MTKIFVHGVPDTAHLWQPLITALALKDGTYRTPDMPGFAGPAPAGFAATKEAYLDWLTDLVETEVSRRGPVDIVAHDWGALLCLRLAHLRPDLVRSWAVINAILEPSYQWHSLARIWQTPVLGEAFMALGRPAQFRATLVKAGMPPDIANHAVERIKPDMKRAILRLYRSAKTLPSDWATDLSGLPRHGLVLWGDQDRYVPIRYARQFFDTHDVPLHVEEGAGHWALCQRPDSMAARLTAHWSAL